MANIPPNDHSTRWELYAPACRDGQRGAALLFVITALAASILYAIHPQGFLAATNFPAIATFGGVGAASLVLFAVCSAVRLRSWIQNNKVDVKADPPPLLAVPLPVHQEVQPPQEEAPAQPELDAQDLGRRRSAALQGARELAQGEGIEGNDADAAQDEIGRIADELMFALEGMAAALPMPEPDAPGENLSDAARAALPPGELDDFHVVKENESVVAEDQVANAHEINNAKEVVPLLMEELQTLLEEMTQAYCRATKKPLPNQHMIAEGVQILRGVVTSYIEAPIDPSQMESIGERKKEFFQTTLPRLLGWIVYGFNKNGVFTTYSDKLKWALKVGAETAWNGVNLLVAKIPGVGEILDQKLSGYPLDDHQKAEIKRAAKILFSVLLEPMATIGDKKHPLSQRFQAFLETDDARCMSPLDEDTATLEQYLVNYLTYLARYTQAFRAMEF